MEMTKEQKRLYKRGCKCSLHGVKAIDMDTRQLIAFVGYLDEVANALNRSYSRVLLTTLRQNSFVRRRGGKGVI